MREQHYAGFWIRVLASLIDTVILLVLSSVCLGLFYGMRTIDQLLAQQNPWVSLLNWVLPIALTVFFWVRYLGTPGKLLLGLHVVDAETGAPLRTPQAIGRYLGYYVSLLALGLGFIWVAFDSRKQGFHDKLAGTVVIHERGRQAQSQKM